MWSTALLSHRYFNAPELLLGKPYDAKADVFAYGIFLCELITRGAINLVRRKETAFGLDVKVEQANADEQASANERER